MTLIKNNPLFQSSLMGTRKLRIIKNYIALTKIEKRELLKLRSAQYQR